MCEFRKQPISPPPGSDSELCASSDGLEKPRQVSLLSSLLSEHSSPSKAGSTGYISGASAPSSAPSTAFSSPRAQEEPISILRRSSMGSDGEPFHLGTAHVHVAPLSPSPKQPISHDNAKPHAILLHESMADEKNAVSSRRPSLKFAVAQPRPLVERVPIPTSDDETTHSGYEEDSEDGFSDDEPTFMMQAMARAREARLRNAKLPPRPASMSPPSRVTEPPPRRGRGHVRVDPAADKDHEHCSRHNSPPPSDARSTRSAPPGPRDGRAGSPVPPKQSSDEDDDDDDDDSDDDNDNDEDNEFGKNAIDDNTRDRNGDVQQNIPLPIGPQRPHVHGSAIDSDVSDGEAESAGIGAGVRKILRRASEHLPSFRRPSFAMTPSSRGDELETSACANNSSHSSALGRSRSVGAKSSASPLRITPQVPVDEPVARSQPLACPPRQIEA